MSHSDNPVLKEYYAFRKREYLLLRERVRHAASVNPDLSWDLMAERFGVNMHVVRGMCRGIPRDRDCFSDFAHGRRRRSHH